ISNRKKLLTQIESEITLIGKESAQKEKEIEALNSELNHLKERYAHLVYNSYKIRDKSIWILYIMAGKSFEQGYKRWSYLKNFSRMMKESAKMLKEKGDTLTLEVERLNTMRRESLKMQQLKEQEYQTLTKEETKAKEIMTQLSKKEQEFRRQITEKRREVERLNREIEKILAEAAKEKKKPGYEESAADRLLSDNFEGNKGRLPWPVKEGVIIEHFGQHNHPVFKGIKLPFNNGVNISTTLNAPVLAVFDGIVKQILVLPGYNQCVLVQHGNFYTFYTKLEEVRVKAGDRVKLGETLGTLAESDGNSVLHFQLWNGIVKQDPETWLSRSI
ncbi:MAG: peptidoglycan DD-metalloendopeptidase family protein, partial [Bacteroidales bacterium]